MLPPKKPIMFAPSAASRQELEHLYARRSAIDDLIQSLEEYDQFRMKRPREDTRQSA